VLSEDEFYDTVINSYSYVKAWVSPDSEIYSVSSHREFIFKQVELDIKELKNAKERRDRILVLNKDPYMEGFKLGWIRLNISPTVFGVEGCRYTVDSKLDYLRSLANQTNRKIDVMKQDC
jgi:hypothetical protein